MICGDALERGARSLSAAVALAFLIAFLIACGSEDPPAPTPESSTAETPEQEAGEPAPTDPNAIVPMTEEDKKRLAERMAARPRKTRVYDKFEFREGDEITESGFPDEVPLYPNAKATREVAQEEMGLLGSFESGDSADDIYGFYLEKLTAGGWEIEVDISAGGLNMLKAKREGRTVTVMIPGGTGDRTNFTVAYAYWTPPT